MQRLRRAGGWAARHAVADDRAACRRAHRRRRLLPLAPTLPAPSATPAPVPASAADGDTAASSAAERYIAICASRDAARWLGGADPDDRAAPFSTSGRPICRRNDAPSPSETRVAREGEIAQDGTGFFILTFNDGVGKLVIGGGAAGDAAADRRAAPLVVGGRGGQP